MKTFSGILLVMVMFIACSSHDRRNTCKEESVEGSSYLEVKPITYQGHRYLWFRAQTRKGFGGVTHDPDCKCYERSIKMH